MEIEEELNKDLILREKLAIQRTIMANQTTVLSFLRTSMYFLIAGLSLRNLIALSEGGFLEIVFYLISGILFVTGVINYWFQHTKIEEGKRHIGDYKLEYFSQTGSQKKKKQMTDQAYLNSLRAPSVDDPLRILMSACLAGITCGWDGTASGEYPSALKLLQYDTVRLTRFCPEEFSFGTPREVCDIHGGSGLDVLEGKARVLTESGIDWTAGMIDASEKMLELAQREKIELAVLMDTSAACGSQVIYEGSRFAENKKYQIGAGVCAAQLIRNGFKVISQRDFASLEILYAKIDPAHPINQTAMDHHQIAWYKTYFGK